MCDRYFPAQSSGYRAICAVNAVKHWVSLLVDLEWLCHKAQQIAKETGIPTEHVTVISPHARLRNSLMAWSTTPVRVIHQPSLRNSFVASLAAVWLAGRRVFARRHKPLLNKPRERSVGVTAAWGLASGRFDDFFWWRRTRIPSDRLTYLFDRPDFQPTAERVAEARAMGIGAVALNRCAFGDAAHLLMEERQALPDLLRDGLFAWRLALRSFGLNELDRHMLSQMLRQHLQASELAAQYKALGLVAVFHHQEGQADVAALAIELVGGIRVGYNWSCFDFPDSCALRTHHVFFVWGSHEAQICLDAGSVTQHLLISGCPINEIRPEGRHRQAAQEAAHEIRRRDVRCVLALFDAGTSSSNFYRFFLEWLLDDPTIGFLVKPKTDQWDEVRANGLNGIVQCALDTGRICVLDSDALPRDAALAADFSVGISSLSAVVVSALAGARVLYLDYARLDQGPLKPYATLHSLGPNRCVFYDPESLKDAVQKYVQNPGSNPHLGDASPVIHRFDPFRDGKASQRIGEYVGWYLEGLDSGLGRDRSLEQATSRYAKKWGVEAVVRGLSTAGT
jgi:hypothetical protein